jgi:hypothetical protein
MSIWKKQTIFLEMSSRNLKGHHRDQKVLLFQFTSLTDPSVFKNHCNIYRYLPSSPFVEVLQSKLYNRSWLLTGITCAIVLYLITITQWKCAVLRNATYPLPCNTTRSKSLLTKNFSRNLNLSTSAQKMRQRRVLFKPRQKDALFSCNQRHVEYRCVEGNRTKSLCNCLKLTIICMYH